MHSPADGLNFFSWLKVGGGNMQRNVEMHQQKARKDDGKVETIVDENEERFYFSFYFMPNILV